MKKVFIIHGYEGSPNGGWRPWLMSELEDLDIYAAALSMPSPSEPICEEWMEEIARHVERNKNDEVYLVGHSLGVPAILRYLEKKYTGENVKGAVLVSGPVGLTQNQTLDEFLNTPFDFEKIKSRVSKFVVIHGDNDPRIPLGDAEILSTKLDASLVIVKNGGHLNGSSGFRKLPECLDALKDII